MANVLVFNNFVFHSRRGPWRNTRVFQIQFSILNRSHVTYFVSSQFVGFDKQQRVTFAMSVNPDFGHVKKGTETAQSEVYTKRPVISQTTHICGMFTMQQKK